MTLRQCNERWAFIRHPEDGSCGLCPDRCPNVTDESKFRNENPEDFLQMLRTVEMFRQAQQVAVWTILFQAYCNIDGLECTSIENVNTWAGEVVRPRSPELETVAWTRTSESLSLYIKHEGPHVLCVCVWVDGCAPACIRFPQRLVLTRTLFQQRCAALPTAYSV